MNDSRHRFQTRVADSVAEAFREAIQFIDGWSEYEPVYCWFRGIKDASLSLQPGAYWRADYEEFGPLFDFVQRGVAFASIGGLEDWETYYRAQHHGVPTRLLDWTESFATALFFAFDGWDGSTTPAVWILQPALLNETMLRTGPESSSEGWYGLLSAEQNDEMSIWLPKGVRVERAQTRLDREGYEYNNDWPLAIVPSWRNARSRSQLSMFTIHGRRRAPLNELIAERDRRAADHVALLRLEGFDPERAFAELELLGVRRSSIYPDLDNLVGELSQRFGW